MSHPLDDPFSRVHPFFWPVLWLSLRAFVRWSGDMMEAGHGFAGIGIEITWYGTIHVTRLDLSPEGEAFRRHMAGERCEDGWSVLTAAAGRVDALLSTHNAHLSREGGNPWVTRATGCAGCNTGPWVPAFAGMSAFAGMIHELHALPKGTGPPPSSRAALKSLVAISGRLHPLPRPGEGGARVMRCMPFASN